ncbi:hypothetical protein QFZ60_001593 [Arthrobacter sp. B2I5]|uniref:phage protein Gp36 family protein n=1 Tax=Arthrobacter sp. B2I5 TaxID=3042266 RepID=UPI002784C395|nr:phage protein Gp36 family protein [Arthrobacter sp. B2I5]MDQ0825420.1 hypothetical protein [Arthrobacter sp. B2I5]
MATTLRIDSFDELNIVERGELSLDSVMGSSVLGVRCVDDLVAGQTIYVGQLSREGIEKAVIASIADETTISLVEPLQLAHARFEPVTAVLGDSIHIYRAPNVDGTVPSDDQFTILTTRTIDADQTSTYFKDSTGSSAFWYRYTYFNPITLDETPLNAFDAFRGDDFGHYASLSEIRREAGFENAFNLKDAVIDQQRRMAEAEINASLAGAYTVPFTTVPEIIHTLTIQLAAALLLTDAYGQTPGNKQKLQDARAAIAAYRTRSSVLTDGQGVSLASSEAVTTNLDDSDPRFFRIGDKF